MIHKTKMRRAKARQIMIRKILSKIGSILMILGVMSLMILASSDPEMTPNMTLVYILMILALIVAVIGFGMQKAFPVPKQ